MANAGMVFFRGGTADLEAAARSLSGYRLTVRREGDTLIAGYPDSPQFQIGLATEEHVQLEAAEIGEGTPYAKEMSACTARFEISVDDFDEAIDEINTLMEVQSALQEASQGYLFLPWNGNLSEPWKE